jgi:predicted nuclease of predicted toxin-antitoxin system
MISLYMDEHVSGKITVELRRRGVDVLTVEDEGLKGSPDLLLLERATQLGRAVFTQDDDFLAIAAYKLEEGDRFKGVVYVRQGAMELGHIIEDLEAIALASEDGELDNQVLYLPIIKGLR